MRYTQSQLAVCELGMAVNDKRKNSAGEWVEETTFVDVTLFGRTAEVAAEYVKKGASVLIDGRLKLESWETNDGQKRSKLKVVGEKMQMLGGRQGGGGGGQPQGSHGGGRQQQSAPSSSSDGYGGYDDDPASGSAAPTDDSDVPF